MDTTSTSTPAPRRKGRYAGANLRNIGTSPSSGTIVPTAIPTTTTRRRRYTPVPTSLLNDKQLAIDCTALPDNYSFEVAKTVHRVRESDARRVALQFPEGLLAYALPLSDIIRSHTSARSVVVLGDVTYGACCVDDLTAHDVGADILIHYGHSCLVPVSSTRIPTLYVFVHILFDTTHLVSTLRANFNNLCTDTKKKKDLIIVGTIQFVNTVHELRNNDTLKHIFNSVLVPQRKPLSPGELLGCTAPITPELSSASNDSTVILYVADGRFHLESLMIAHRHIRTFYRYDPYSKSLTSESYNHSRMLLTRRSAIDASSSARRFGLILGTLGRQGSPHILRRLMAALRRNRRHFFIVLLSELAPHKLKAMEHGICKVDAWVQIACPRLSIDWGEHFSNLPLLTPYECFVALGEAQWAHHSYPMDYYARDGGPWTNYYKEPKKDDVDTTGTGSSEVAVKT